MEIESLEKGKSTAVLMALLDGPKNFSTLLSEVGGSATTIKVRIDEFVKEGIIHEQEQGSFPFRRVLTLTKKGLNIAKMLKALKGSAVRGDETYKVLSEKERWVLALLHAFGGEVKGSTRLQKLVFLLKEETNTVDGEFYEFVPKSFGPYSPQLMEDVKELQTMGLVTISEEVFEPEELSEDWIIRRAYKLTSKGEREGIQVYDSLEDSAKQALISLRKYRRMATNKLLQYVHSKYPQYCEEN